MALFITLEGIEGSGKSTLLSNLSAHFSQLVSEVVITHQPGATHFGKKVRELLLNDHETNLTPLTELLLFQADRVQHITEVIKPALARGALVICDRYIHSTVAYQGFGRGLDLNLVNNLNQIAIDNLLPDLVVLLDLDPETGLARANKRLAEQVSNTQVQDKFEQQKLDFHQRVRDGFLQQAQEAPELFAIVDAQQNLDLVFQQVQELITKKLKT